MGVTVWMLVAATLGAQTPARADPLDALITRGRTALRAMRAMKADFRETTVSKLLRDPIVATGHLVATAPAQVLMEYASPERKTLAVDATKLVVTWPTRSERQELNIASTQKRVQKYFSDASTSDLRQSFEMELVTDPALPGADSLVMRPTRKQIQTGLARLQLWIDRARLVLVKMKMDFPNGDSKTLEFDAIQIEPAPTAPAR
ncbi:MAG: outer membrane lipoprotein carrier protein LolA [Acidobacteriota bacterium]